MNTNSKTEICRHGRRRQNPGGVFSQKKHLWIIAAGMLLLSTCSQGLLGSIDSLREKAKGDDIIVDLGKMDIIIAMYRDDDNINSVIAMKPDGTGRKWLYKGNSEFDVDNPSLGSDGKTMLFVEGEGEGSKAVSTYNILTKKLTRLYNKDGNEYFYTPAFSPDMGTVYISKCTYDNEWNQSFTLIAKNMTTGVEKILNDTDRIDYLSFTADGKIVCARGDWASDIVIMDTNGNILGTLKDGTPDDEDHYMDMRMYMETLIIPARDQIVYVKEDYYAPGDPTFCICVMNMYGNETELMNPTSDYYTSPSADSMGTQIAYCIGNYWDGPVKIMVANFSGSSLSNQIVIQDTSANGFSIWRPQFSRMDVSVYNTLEDFNPPLKDLGWYNQTGGPNYYISKPEELAGLAFLVNMGIDGFSGKTITLSGGIDFSAVDNWVPIGSSNASNSFKGTFNGSNNTISNLKGNSEGLFGYIGPGGTVKNLKLAGVNINSHCGLVRNNGGTVDNCSVSGTIIGGQYTGGIAGQNGSGGIIQNCSVTGHSRVGGIAGGNDGTIQDCYTTGDVNCVTGDGVGGISGYNSGPVKNCYTTGNITGTLTVGGVVASSSTWYAEGPVLENCYSTGKVTGTVGVGGIAGSAYRSSVVNCYSTGDITGTENVGGIAGSVYTYNSNMQYCYAVGNVSGEKNVGGIAGSNTSYIVKNCAALNSSIIKTSESIETSFGRVAGINTGSLYNNYANSAMTVNDNAVTTGTASNINGADLVSGTGGYSDITWWTNTTESIWYNKEAWNETVWDFAGINNGINLPRLKGMPGGTAIQNPVIKQ